MGQKIREKTVVKAETFQRENICTTNNHQAVRILTEAQLLFFKTHFLKFHFVCNPKSFRSTLMSGEYTISYI